MTIALYCMLYIGVLVFVAGCVVRAVSYASKPIHLRWEIYPLPHGTSGELKIMIPEILFLKGLWEFNRRMWWVSYPFHLGLYLDRSSHRIFGRLGFGRPRLSGLYCTEPVSFAEPWGPRWASSGRRVS